VFGPPRAASAKVSPSALLGRPPKSANGIRANDWFPPIAGGFGLIFILPVAVWVVVDAFLIPGWVSTFNARLLSELDGGASAALVTAS
jgi:hypothetical protein